MPQDDTMIEEIETNDSLPTEQPEPQHDEEGHAESQSADTPPSKMSELLDSLTDNGDDSSQPTTEESEEVDESEEDAIEQPLRGPDGRFLSKDSPPPAKADGLPDNPEEAELLENFNSDRGRERIRQVFAERKQYESDLNEIRTMVSSTGMSPQEFAQALEYGRLSLSNNPDDWRVALQMADAQRDMICKRLGVDAPGVDTLSDFPDLVQAVSNGEIQRERAIEVATLRRERQTTQQRQQVEYAAQQEQQQFALSVEQGKASMAQYLQSRSHEVDHSARMKVVESYFSDPNKLQEFASTYQPQQWASAVRMLYDSVQIAATQQRPRSPSPISSRPSMLGKSTVNYAQEPEKRIEQIMDKMGL